MGWLLRGVALVAVFAMALFAFWAGVGVSDRASVPDAPLLAKVYYAAGLFVLGGLDLGTPVSGPEGARALLWGAYFGAPLITTSAVVEGALRLVGSRALERFGLGSHLVLVGLGRLGTTFAKAARQWDPDCQLVAVERDVRRAAVNNLRRELGVKVFQGEAHLRSSLGSVRLERARGVALLTDDDLLNLEVAYRLAADHPELSVVAHVSDVGLQRAAIEIEPSAGRVRVFNAHRCAAEHLYLERLQPYFESTAARDNVVLAGFGRFGQALLEFFERQSGESIARVVVVDQKARAGMRSFRERFGEPAFEVEALDGDLGDPETWDRIARDLGPLEAPPVVVVGTQDDGANVLSGLHARRRWAQSPVFVRCQNESTFTEALAQRHGLTVLAVNSLLRAALCEEQRRWFAPPGERRRRLGSVAFSPWRSIRRARG